MIDDGVDPPGTHATTIASPSPRVWTGVSARAMPSCPPCATTKQPTLSSAALVATTPMVVFSTAGPAPKTSGRRRRPVGLAAVVDVAHRVHGHERADDEIAVAHGRAADPTRARRARDPATSRSSPRCPRRCARAARRPASRLDTGRVALDADRAAPWLSPTSRSKSAERDDDGHRPGAGREARALLGAPAHHAVGSGETEGRATCEQHGVDSVRPSAPARADRTPASPARRRAPRPTPCVRPGTGHRAAGRRLGMGPVPDPHAGDVGDHAVVRRGTRGGTRALMPHTIS